MPIQACPRTIEFYSFMQMAGITEEIRILASPFDRDHKSLQWSVEHN